MTKEIIGIVGPIASGKDTAGDYLSGALHIPSFQISSSLKDICAESRVEPTRNNLILLGTQLAAEYGDGYLAEYILERAPDRAIITGMRQLGQIAVLKANSNLTLLSVDADPPIRFERAKKNGKLGEAKTLEEFVAHELAENTAPNAQRLFEVMRIADHHLVNEATIKDLHEQIDSILSLARPSREPIEGEQ